MNASFGGYLVRFLTGNFPFAPELWIFWVAWQGQLGVRNSINQECRLNWFHALMYGLVSGFGGGTFAPLWMGRPAATLASDLPVFFVVVTFLFTYYSPFDIGFKIGNLFPVRLIMTMFFSLFKTRGLVGYVDGAFQAFQDQPSAYYPIPVFGPICWATILGNMGPFFIKGFHKHLENGMPWAFQQGLITASFYHFYVNDETGPIGILLRRIVRIIPGAQMGLDDRTFAMVVVATFIQTCSVLQMPQFLGPSFSPFVLVQKLFLKLLVWFTNAISRRSTSADEEESIATDTTSSKKSRKRKKKKKTTEGPITDYKKNN